MDGTKYLSRSLREARGEGCTEVAEKQPLTQNGWKGGTAYTYPEESRPSQAHCLHIHTHTHTHTIPDPTIYHTGAFLYGGSDSGIATLRYDRPLVGPAYQESEGWLLEVWQLNPDRPLQLFVCNAIISRHPLERS